MEESLRCAAPPCEQGRAASSGLGIGIRLNAPVDVHCVRHEMREGHSEPGWGSSGWKVQTCQDGRIGTQMALGFWHSVNHWLTLLLLRSGRGVFQQLGDTNVLTLDCVTKSIFPELPLPSLFSRLLWQAPMLAISALSSAHFLYLWSQEKPSESSAWQTRIEPQP